MKGQCWKASRREISYTVLGQSGFSFLKSLLTRASSGEVGGQGHEWVLGKQSWASARAVVGARRWVSKRNVIQRWTALDFLFHHSLLSAPEVDQRTEHFCGVKRASLNDLENGPK